MRRIAVLLALSLPLLAGGWVRAEEPAPLDDLHRAFDQLHLEIRVTPDLARGTVDGTVCISFEALREGLAALDLHCVDTQVRGVAGPEGEALAFTQTRDRLRVQLATALAHGSGSRVTITYRSRPTRGLYFHRPTAAYPDTPRFLYSQGQSNDNRRWIPCYDLPDDRFAWDLYATVPADLQTVSNGLLTSSEDHDDRRTDHWTFAEPAPSYLIGLIVAPLETVRDSWRDTVLEYSALPGRTEALRTALRETPAMMDFFSTWVDEPYPWPRYAQTFVWDFVYGGMENITATTLNMRALHLEAARPNYTSEGLVAHELAHMWFGDLLTCRTWHDIWLNEGFATYLTDLYFEHRDGGEEFRLRRRRQNRGYMDGTPKPEALGLSRHPRGDRPLELSGGKAYSRGAAILHMLRLELGDELFRRAIARYVDEFRDESVTSEEFRRTVEQVAGRDLAWFWDQWVYGAGYPVLEVRWRPERRVVEVRQVQARQGPQGLFRLTLPVRLDADGPVEHLRIWKERHTFRLQAPSQAHEDYLRVGIGGDLLARIRYDAGFEGWVAALARDGDATARLDALDGLDTLGVHDLEGMSALAGALADSCWAVRQRTAEILGEMETSPHAVALLVGATGDADPRVRETALTALGGFHRDEASEALVRALAEETHDYPRAAAAQSLGRVHAAGAYDTLIALLDTESHEQVVRAGALRGLAALGDLGAVGRARAYCDYAWGGGGTTRLRDAALDCALALEPDSMATRALLFALLEDPHHRMRARAAEECGTYGVRAARARLRRLVESDAHGNVRGAAAKALERLKD